MTVHYQTKDGKESMLTRIIHLQNADNGKMIALFDNVTELTLLVNQIEGVFYENVDRKAGSKLN